MRLSVSICWSVSNVGVRQGVGISWSIIVGISRDMGNRVGICRSVEIVAVRVSNWGERELIETWCVDVGVRQGVGRDVGHCVDIRRSVEIVAVRVSNRDERGELQM